MAPRENFSSRLAVVLAMAGSAIGLGNIWRFPYMAGEYGGAVFVLVYIVATIVVSMPLFISEIVIGRRSRSNAKHAMGKLLPGKPFWKEIGIVFIAIPIIITSYYSVIGGWSVDFMIRSFSPAFYNQEPDQVMNAFGSIMTGTWEPIIMHILFLGLSVIVVCGGVKSGIELFSRITLPLLFVMIVAIAIYSITLPGAMEGVKYLFKPDFSQLTPKVFAYAMGQSFYSLSLGMGCIITYGSYVKKDENIMATSVGTSVCDLGFALLAGLAIMPAVFAAGIEPGSGPGLIFQSLPYVFAKMGGGAVWVSCIVSFVFFFSVVIAAMTSCISLIEVAVAYLVERYDMKRVKASILIFMICGALGIICSLSFGPLANIQVAHKNIFDIFDWLSSNVLLLLMGLVAVVFVGFAMKKEDVRDEVTNGGSIKACNRFFGPYYFLVRWVCPIAVLVIFIMNFLG